MINKKIYVKPKELINFGAELCEISTTTAKRYLDKMCSKEGLCTRLVVGLDLMLNIHCLKEK